MERRERAGSRLSAYGRAMMAGTSGVVRIGTSGWQYRHWVGPFYPEKTPTARMLGRYAQAFSTTEVNGTFYHLPRPATVAGWIDATPPGFVFSCKANRYITHMKKLKDPAETLPAFLAVVEALGEKSGPALFQLPPHWHVDADRLKRFLGHLPAGRRHVFEFRDPSWWSDAVIGLLRDHGAGFCIFDLEGTPAPAAATADFVYLRLHGPGEAYRGSYTDDVLADWAAKIDRWAQQGLDVYVYFDNDADAGAPLNAITLSKMIAPSLQALPPPS